ncbi:MAG: hypothetical protein Q8K70_12625 [Bacteroidota bacterium]|nr:hypothetical protein [Bacteroidota bacterium]
MKNLLILLFASLCFSSCKKEKSNNNALDIPNPMVDKRGWNLVKHSPEFYFLKSSDNINVPITLDLVKEHDEGIDILYSSIFNFATEYRKINVRWKAYHNKEHDVKKVEVTGHSIAFLGRVVPSKTLDVYSTGMGESDLFAINEQEIELSSRTRFEYSYFNVRSSRNNLDEFKPHESTTFSSGGIASANPNHPFSANGFLVKQFKNPTPIYNYSISAFAAAPKGNELVMFGFGPNNTINIIESTNKLVYQVISSQGVLVRPTVVKNVFDISEITKTTDQNDVVISKFFYDEHFLYVFLGLSNKKHRFLKINLANYTLSSENESMYEQMDLSPGFKNVLMLNDRPGEMLSMEKDGIYHISKGTKTFIPSASVKVGTSGTTAYYSNGKIWQILFDENGAYLINRTI